MSFLRYPEYKDSAVEWLGEVPAHWQLSKLKHAAHFTSGGTPSKERRDYWNGDVPWASSKDLKRDAISDTEDHITDLAVADRAQMVREGDIMVVVRGMILAHTFPVTTARAPMAINQDLKGIRPADGWDAGYFAHLLRASSPETFRRLDEAGHGTKALRMETWTAMLVPQPPAFEQAAIASFLDRETAKIDVLVAEQQRLIELLNEKRQAVISHAVTKGLNPDAPMKDSGVEWIGEMPAHWELRRTRTVSSFTTSGPRGWSERIGNDGALFIQSGDLDESMGVDFGNAKRVVVQEDAESARTRLRTGDVLVCITGAKTGNVAVCPHVPEPAYVNQHLCLVRPTGDILPGFLGMLLKGAVGQTHFALSQYGLKQGLSLDDVREAPVLVPPPDEQTAVLEYLDAQAAKVIGLTAEAQRAIDLLQERRTALISAAVTGQIDVRDAAARSAA